MSLFQLSALFLTLVAAVAWTNSRWLRLPPGVAMLAAGLIGAAALDAAKLLAPGASGVAGAIETIRRIDFAQTVVGYMLGFLLFAGAMQVDLHELRRRRLAVWTLATVFPWGAYFHFRQGERGPSMILAWGGLHGALSLALALSIPPGPHRPLILSLTYAVVVFSVGVQGLTFGPLVDALRRTQRDRARSSSAAEA